MTASALRGLEPLSSPLDAQQLSALNHALKGLSSPQLAWISGYLAGVGGLALPAEANAAQDACALTILYGSQTGNACRVAASLGEQAQARGLAVKVQSMGEYKFRELVRERLALIVISTQGEGEPPESARDLHAFVHGKRVPRLEALRYAVLGLGDSSYEHFCRAARELDQRLSELGAQRMLPLTCCDVDFAGPAGAWAKRALEKVAELIPAKRADVLRLPGAHLVQHNRHDRDNPYPATLIEHRRLTTDDAVSDVRHFVLTVDPQQVRYAPGDALGVWFRNDPALVEQILRATGLSADATVTLGSDELRLADALLERLELTQLHPTVIKAWAQLSGDRRLKEVVADKARLMVYAAEHQPIDLLTEFAGRPEPVDFIEALQALKPRLYSIACSQAEYEDEVHLAVAVVRFHRHARDHLGGASGFLAERLTEGDTTGVYVVEKPEFRLPDDGATPIIMVGAGTGVAPYRAFLQQRAADGAAGRNWLVLGNRHFHSDFLYQLDWQAWRQAGLLQRASLAFSRDGADKIYVQQRLREQAADVYRWLAEGAHLYVCGAIAMGQAVNQALLDVAALGGGLSAEASREFIDGLRGAGRYHKDLY